MFTQDQEPKNLHTLDGSLLDNKVKGRSDMTIQTALSLLSFLCQSVLGAKILALV